MRQRKHEKPILSISFDTTHLTSPSSPAVTPVWSPTHTTLFTIPSWVNPPVSLRKSGSASGLPRSKILTFFSCPPVKRCEEDGDNATLRTIWLCGNEWSRPPEYVSQIFLQDEKARVWVQKTLLRHGQQYWRGKVCTPSGRSRGIRWQLGTPNSTLMPQESANPVPRPFPQHRVTIFATWNDQVRAIILNLRKRKVSNGSRMTWCHERSCFNVGWHYKERRRSRLVVVEIIVNGAPALACTKSNSAGLLWECGVGSSVCIFSPNSHCLVLLVAHQRSSSPCINRHCAIHFIWITLVEVNHRREFNCKANGISEIDPVGPGHRTSLLLVLSGQR